jgi:hypothetical protein
MWRELCYFHKYASVPAMPKRFRCGTLGQCRDRSFGQRNRQHRGIGKSADMIVLSGNPLEDLKALRAPESVIIKGKLIAHPHPQKNAKMEAMLDTLIA